MKKPDLHKILNDLKNSKKHFLEKRDYESAAGVRGKEKQLLDRLDVLSDSENEKFQEFQKMEPRFIHQQSEVGKKENLSGTNGENNLKTSLKAKNIFIRNYAISGSFPTVERFFFAYFGEVPNEIKIISCDWDSSIQWIEKELSACINRKHTREEWFYGKRKLIETIFVLKNKIVISVDTDTLGTVIILFSEELLSEANKIFNHLKRFANKKIQNNYFINIVTNGNHGLKLVQLKNKKPVLNLQENYNDDLFAFHQNMTAGLKRKNDNGLYLLHGKPGTGKSTYIRYLIHLLNKKITFLPPKVALSLDTPDFTELLINNKNSIIIIEDAEELLISREMENNSSISMLLNLTDGILGECLGIKIICTFNTEMVNIDKALLRKGRLKALYHFDQLTVEKSKALLSKFGVNGYEVKGPMTLAEIYNIKEKDFGHEINAKKPIGFAFQGNGLG